MQGLAATLHHADGVRDGGSRSPSPPPSPGAADGGAILPDPPALLETRTPRNLPAFPGGSQYSPGAGSPGARPSPGAVGGGGRSPAFSRFSNRKLIRNAINHVCLAGAARQQENRDVLTALEACPEGCNFVVLFKNSRSPLHFKGLYMHKVRQAYLCRMGAGKMPSSFGNS